MGAALDALRELQEIEHQIVDVKRQLRKKERVVETHQKKMDNLEKQIASERNELKRTQVAFQQLDVDVKSRSANIQKSREQLNSVKTNKEYAAVLAQLNNDKADVTQIEQQALEKMQEIEARQAAISEKVDELNAAESRRAELQDQADQTKQSYAGKLAELEAERSKLATAVPKEALVLFDRLSERFDGEVLATCERTHPRKDEYLCGGCYLSLSAEVANTLMTKDEIVTCRNCGRILVMAAS
ncbi:MAG: zinc ribbon domain-containing protein [Phycisphaerae bacterium]